MKRPLRAIAIPFFVFVLLVTGIAALKLLGGMSGAFDNALVVLFQYFLNDFGGDLAKLFVSPFRIAALFVSVGLLAFVADWISNRPPKVAKVAKEYDSVIRGRRLGRRPPPISDDPSDDDVIAPRSTGLGRRLTRRQRRQA